MRLTLVSRKPSKRFPLTVEVAGSDTLNLLRSQIHKLVKLSVERQRLTTVDKKVLDDDSLSLTALGLKEGDTIDVKDLGPQISWRTVFLVEYAGPIFIHPLFYFGGEYIYGTQFQHSRMQTIAMTLVLLHYLKREIETIFVHRFSSATMPRFNLVKNSAHYWILSGVLLSAPLYGPWNSSLALASTLRDSTPFIISLVSLWSFAEISNAIVHLHLRSLRTEGTKERKIPTGYGFGLMSCPNYYFEAIAWISFTILTMDWAAALFTAVSAGQMLVWAGKKHQRYKKDFGKDYPRGRKAMIPFLF